MGAGELICKSRAGKARICARGDWDGTNTGSIPDGCAMRTSDQNTLWALAGFMLAILAYTGLMSIGGRFPDGVCDSDCIYRGYDAGEYDHIDPHCECFDITYEGKSE